ncbi:MAG: DNA polymerase III subunit delta [Hydrogenothermaceae bacterium]|nr:DNA polymerase III subunit delta [Hydrogenothermaceae bacterium]
MEVKAQQFIKELDIKSLKNVIVVFGNDQLLKSMVLDKIKTSLTPVIFWGDEVSYDTVLTQLKVQSLFGEKPSVVVKNASDFISNLSKEQIKEFLEILRNIKNQKIILIFSEDQLPQKEPYKSLVGMADLITCAKLTKPAFISSLKKKVENENLKIEDRDLEYLANLLNYDLTIAKPEVEKLILYCKDTGRISREDIDNIITSSSENSIFEFLEMFFKRDKEVITLYDKLIEKSFHPFQIQTFLVNHLEKVLYYKILTANGVSNEEALSKVGVYSPVQKNNIIRHSKFMAVDELKEILKMLYTLEINQKVFYKDIELEAKNFLIKVIKI